MREFFKGWRRNAGYGLLVVACAMTGMWMRSRIMRDELRIPGLEGQVESALNSIRWSRTVELKGEPRSKNIPAKSLNLSSERIHTFETLGGRAIPDDCDIMPATWQFCGISYAHAATPWTYGPFGRGVLLRLWIVPYWTVVLPLTLLSAFLILWKPRKRSLSPQTEVG